MQLEPGELVGWVRAFVFTQLVEMPLYVAVMSTRRFGVARPLPWRIFVAFLCSAVWRSWAPVLGKSDLWEKIYERDGYRCRCPVCFSIETTLHHLRYRSRGGTHAKWNVISLCPFCHLKGEHEARLKVRGTADAPKWILGRRPILVVEGRTKREPRDDERRLS